MKLIMILAIIASVGLCGVGKGDFSSLSNDDFAKMLSDKQVQLVDVRTNGEFSGGHIENAINIDVNDPRFEDIVRQRLNPKYPIAVYCRSGSRSKSAAAKLAKKGFKVYELDKGVMRWDGKLVK